MSFVNDPNENNSLVAMLINIIQMDVMKILNDFIGDIR